MVLNIFKTERKKKRKKNLKKDALVNALMVNTIYINMK